MARLFDGTSDYLGASSVPDASIPMTFGAWVRLADTSGTQTVFTTSSSSSNSIFERLQTNGTALRLRTNNGGSGRNVTSSGTLSATTWHHACAVISAADSRTVYLDGGNAVTGTDTFAPSTDQMGIAASVRATSVTHYLAGRVGFAFFYGAALSASEVAALAQGASPMLVRSGALVGFWPIWGIESPETDYIGTTQLVVSGSPTQADGPPTAPNLGAAASMPQAVEDITPGPYNVSAFESYQAGATASDQWQGGAVTSFGYQAGGVASDSV
jgi:hypothetical protein